MNFSPIYRLQNQALKNSLEAAQLNVSSLHGSLVALESSTSSYNAILAEKEDTIQQLTTQVCYNCRDYLNQHDYHNYYYSCHRWMPS